MARFGRVRHSAKKVRAWHKRFPNSTKSYYRRLKVDVIVVRSRHGSYNADSCFLASGLGQRRPKASRCSGAISGSTPTSAIRKSLVRLGRKIH